MQDGCKVYMDFILHGIECIMFHDHLDYYQIPHLGGRPNTKPGDHGTSNAHNCCFIIFYHFLVSFHSGVIFVSYYLM
jgi:hypothetical protein